MQSGEGQRGGASHRAAGDEDSADAMSFLEVANDLNQIRFRLRSHPGGLRSVVGRDVDHVMFGSDVARGAAFVTSVSHELPPVGAVAVQRDQHVVRFVGLKLGRKKLHETLLGLVDVGLKGNVFGLWRIAECHCGADAVDEKRDGKSKPGARHRSSQTSRRLERLGGAGQHAAMKIELRNVSKSYGRVHALEDVTLDIEPGQIISLLGVNGSGKTTLLRCLSGISVPDRGDVLFDGELFRRSRTDQRQRLHFLPDFPFFYPRMSVLQHIGLVAKAYEKTEHGTEQRVVELLEDFDLLPLIKSSVGRLSRGQQYKVALIAMMIADPELWLFDEPFASGMDPLGLSAFRRLARDAARRGRIVIYSTQLLELAESFSDRVCVINGGKLHAFDTMFNLSESSQAAPGAVLEDLFAQLRETAEP